MSQSCQGSAVYKPFGFINGRHVRSARSAQPSGNRGCEGCPPVCIAARSTALRSQFSPSLPVVCVHEFLAVVTNPKIFRQPTPRATAFAQMDVLLAQSGARLLMPTPEHLAVLRQLTEAGQTVGAQFHDARIAAICLENGVTTLWTADRDFSVYPQLLCQSAKDLVTTL